MRLTPEQDRQRFESLRSQRRTVETTWDIVERFVAPYRGEMFRDQQSEHEQDWRRREVYETTAITAAQTLAASIHGSLTSASTKWFHLRFRDEELNSEADASAWLEEVGKLIYFELQESDFNLEINECYLDLTTFGTSVLIEELVDDSVWRGIDFTAIPIKECFFEEDHKSGLLRLYRRLQWTSSQIVDKFGDDTPADIKEAAGNSRSIDAKEEIIFVIFRRDDKRDRDTTLPLAPKERPWGFRYIRHKDAAVLGEEGGYYEMPGFVPRWRVTSESMWGNSPAMIALADILTLNQLVELDLRAREKVIDPATLTTERGLLSDLDLGPAGLTVVRSLDDIKVHESGARFDATNDTIQRLQMQIRSVFHVDELEMKESPAMTATEVQVRYELMQRLLGPTLGRLQSDLLDPLIMRTFNLMLRAGRLPEVPEILKDDAADMDIEYLGPLNRAQKMDRVAAVERFAAQVLQLAQAQPNVLDKVDWDAAVDEVHAALDVPAAVLRGQAEVEEEREKRNQQEQMMQAAQMAQEAGMGMQAVGDGAASLAQGQQGGPDGGLSEAA